MKTFKITETSQKTSEILAKMKSLFPVRSYYDDARLDADFPIPAKTTHEFQYSIEPDATILGKSAREADSHMTGITLRERLLMEIEYFKETGQHLDVKGWTICSGSRDSVGCVPSVDFHPGTGKVEVCCGRREARREIGIRTGSIAIVKIY